MKVQQVSEMILSGLRIKLSKLKKNQMFVTTKQVTITTLKLQITVLRKQFELTQ